MVWDTIEEEHIIQFQSPTTPPPTPLITTSTSFAELFFADSGQFTQSWFRVRREHFPQQCHFATGYSSYL